MVIAIIVGTVVGLVTEEVLNWICRIRDSKKPAAPDLGEGLDGIERLKFLLQSLEAGREEVIKGLEKAKKGS